MKFENITELEGLLQTLYVYRDQQIIDEEWDRVERDIQILNKQYFELTGANYRYIPRS